MTLLLLVKLEIEDQMKQFSYCILCLILVQEEWGSPELGIVLLKLLKVTIIISTLYTAFTFTDIYTVIKSYIEV